MSNSDHSHGLVHKHFILDAELVAHLDFAKRHEITHSLIDDLLKTLEMQELGPLEIYDATDNEYPGWSFIQPITTSHISGHYFEEKKGISHVHMDIYSCKEYSDKEALKIIFSHLKLSKWSANLIYREIALNKRKTIILDGEGEDTISKNII